MRWVKNKTEKKKKNPKVSKMLPRQQDTIVTCDSVIPMGKKVVQKAKLRRTWGLF